MGSTMTRRGWFLFAAMCVIWGIPAVPLVRALLGVTVSNESFSVGMGVGFVLILAGSILATRPSGRAAEPAVAAS
jgi:hypothetical protein